jgi:hypothetical protein
MLKILLLVVLCIFGYQTSFAQILITTVRDGDSRISRFSGTTGAFVGQVGAFSVSSNNYALNSDVEFDGQYYYGVSNNDATIRRFNASGQFLNDVTTLRVENHPSQPNGLISNQTGLAMDSSYYYSIGVGDSRVRQYSLNGVYIRDICNLHDQYGNIFSQTGLSKLGDFFYAIANNDNRVGKYDLTGAFIEDAFVLTNPGQTGQNALFLATGIAIQSIPEPSALSLLAVGLGTFAMTRRRRS